VVDRTDDASCLLGREGLAVDVHRAGCPGAGRDAHHHYGIRRLGSLDAIHLATADPLLPELTGLVTYDVELAAASSELGIAVLAPT
jgi:hypothetical protein